MFDTACNLTKSTPLSLRDAVYIYRMYEGS